MNVRDATARDAATISAIYAPIVRETVTSFELEPPSPAEIAQRISRVQRAAPWIVVEDEGEVIGYAYATSFRARPAYAATVETSVYVHEAHRGRGVARHLMGALLEDLRRRGLRRAIAGIALPNEPSVRLHEALGFEPVGVFHEVGRKFDRWVDVGFWERAVDLDPQGQ